jgi:hypothetical protein
LVPPKRVEHAKDIRLTIKVRDVAARRVTDRCTRFKKVLDLHGIWSRDISAAIRVNVLLR